ncbi:hypothetical protein CLV98_12523 [Dyadobacter jejuensis]|uniref:Gliding motility-associated lipoprotein GldH n=1 Tax=Dyadobacter jejuensis TaxID=1082580 RepID=A0A316A8E0_9BACT|nr:hypothetical protein [Dyadobacter jejuensis]PWJ53240.1 hypothetical protein CLV98_12523 [Dyadobacter jejuensis]
MKHTTKRMIWLAAFSLFVLFQFSCTEDHAIKRMPVLKTLPTSLLPSFNADSTYIGPPYFWIFNLEVVDKGTEPIKEYGVVLTQFRPDPNETRYEPFVDNTFKNAFEQPFEVGPATHRLRNNYAMRTYVYQKAYAILESGEVVYGNLVVTENGTVISQ